MSVEYFWTIKNMDQDLNVREIAQDLRAIIAGSGVPIANGYGEPGSRPAINESFICFNGVDDEGQDGFSYPPGIDEGDSKNDVFDFCETYGHPYDVVVAATLIAIKHHQGDNVQISSDIPFDSPEWDEAYDLYRTALGRQVPQIIREYKHSHNTTRSRRMVHATV